MSDTGDMGVTEVVSSLKNVLLARGFVEFIDHHHAANSWNFQWKTTRYSDRESIGPEAASSAPMDGPCHHRQKINHFQKTTGICRKDTLARNLRRMQKTWGSVYSFSPQTFILPRELKEFEVELARAPSSDGDLVWICKPSSSSQGKNIFLIRRREELQFDCSFVVQRYIANPMLIGGYKYDLRIYVLVTSFRPLCVYMYREGLARFSSQKYDPSDTSNLFSHLTNASINKSSPDLLTDKEVIGAGCKWTMDRWFQHLESIGCNPYVVWEQIKDIAILTLLPIVADVPDNTRCFELFGFDVMLDQHWKPWIIEVNASPAIAISGMQDTTVKIPLLNDLLDAIGFPASESLDESTNIDNLLPPGHVSFDPHAEQRAKDAAVAAVHAAAAGAANAVDSDGEAMPSAAANTTGTTLNAANRGHQVQRVPRIVKMQTQKGRDALSAAAAAKPSGPSKSKSKTVVSSSSAGASSSSSSSSSASSVVSSSRRRLATVESKSSRIPRPSMSPVGHPSASSAGPACSPERSDLGAMTPSKIPVRRRSGIEALPAAAISAATHAPAAVAGRPKMRRAVSAHKSATLASVSSSAARTSSTGVAGRARPAATSSTLPGPLATISAHGVAASHGRSRTRVPVTGPVSVPSVSRSSTGLAPELIGDFERIFPFDSVTASASDGIATASVLKAKTTTPLPLLFADFAKTTIGAVKSRVRARDKIAAERAAHPEWPLRFAFTQTSRLHSPSPWTPAAIQAAVAQAKEAARRERARLGLPEPPNAATIDAEESIDESVPLEQAIARAKQQQTEAIATASAASAISE